MRLTQFQQRVIKDEVARIMGEGVRVLLFGSRTDDSRRGGDIDLYLETPEGIDRLESFASKFSRMQDTFVDKLLPIYLRSLGELPGPSTTCAGPNNCRSPASRRERCTMRI